MRYNTYEEMVEAISDYCDATFSPLNVVSNTTRMGRSFPKRKTTYQCKFGVCRKTLSKGIRQPYTSNYVGCPVFLRINQQDDGKFYVVRADLEHKNHEVNQESYLLVKRRLTKDQRNLRTQIQILTEFTNL